MKRTLRSRLAAALVPLTIAAPLAIGGSLLVAPVVAERADAYTDRNCITVSKDYQFQRRCWRDYTWWEENCLYCWRGVDGYVYTPLPRYPG